MGQNIEPTFASDATLQLTAPATTAVSLLSLLKTAGENETSMLKISTWSLDIEGVSIRMATNGNSPTPSKGFRLQKDFSYPVKGTADRIFLVSTGANSLFNITPGVLSKGFV